MVYEALPLEPELYAIRTTQYSGDVRALGFHVDRVERLAAGHEEAVALGPTEADVAADLRQQDLADAGAVRREDVDAVVPVARPAGARPHVSIRVGADTVGQARLAVQLHRDELAAARQPLLVHHVPDLDVLRGV